MAQELVVSETAKGMVAFCTGSVQIDAVRRTVDLDKELDGALKEVVSLTKEKPATVIRQALRAGLPVVASRFQAPRPEGYFTDAYPRPRDRQKLEAAMAKVKQQPGR